METKKLEQIGLTRNQSLVYLSLLKLGSTTAQEVMKDSGLHSSRVYESLEKLQEIGLASYVIKGFKKYFQASAPQRLMEYLDEKKHMVSQLLPELESMVGMKREQITAQIYKGKEGLKSIHSEMLKECKDVYLIGAKGLVFKELQYFMPHFEKEREKKKIRLHLIYDSLSAMNLEKKRVKRKFLDGKAFPKGYASSAVVNVFGSKTAIVLWDKKYPTGFMIENEGVASAFRRWFAFIYRHL